jgi:sulfatase maturation enzyme AslB (radical SAM superfamily)
MQTDQNNRISILNRKKLANAYLPRLAEGFVRNEIGLDEICRYFENVAHLYSVGVDVNAVCNLKCGYCYLDKYNRETAPNYVDLEYLFAFLDSAIDCGVEVIALVGKEPFADDRGIQVLNHLHKMRLRGNSFRYGVVTNGTLLLRYIDQIPQSISYIDVSLDGDQAKTDAMRGPGVYLKAKAALKHATDRGFDTWISSVMYAGASDARATANFMEEIAGDTGCDQFYLSPIRNFTGALEPHLVTYGAIQTVQQALVENLCKIESVKRVILDHPYESVWRDYFMPVQNGESSRLSSIQVDNFGNLLHKLSATCFRKLDVFPHGPWGTCRVDATGAYLSDVESRTFARPQSVGNIENRTASSLHSLAVRKDLRLMMSVFVDNMRETFRFGESASALTRPTLLKTLH